MRVTTNGTGKVFNYLDGSLFINYVKRLEA